MEIYSNEEKKAIEKLSSGTPTNLIEIIRKMKREGIERFVVTRPEYILIVLNLIQKQEKEIEKKDKIIDLMSERIQEDSKWFYSDFKFNAKSQEEIKQYFEELVENGR
jgi:Glu-tRNA(Gln) amidotransferase subunit E-like FAD-binding protein